MSGDRTTEASGGHATLLPVSSLILPPAVAPAKKLKSRCYLCGRVESEHQRQFLRHVRSCARNNVEGAALHRAAQNEQTFFTSSPDPERDAHLARGGN